MGQASPFLRNAEYGWIFLCPGCGVAHHIQTRARTEDPEECIWWFNGDVNKPTFTPSILGTWQEGPVDKPVNGICHYNLTDGKIQYHTDCTHHLVGKTVDLPVLPSFLQS